ncbi:MAG: apolipoprotein N-acyltransferase [Opitutales bacterium]
MSVAGDLAAETDLQPQRANGRGRGQLPLWVPFFCGVWFVGFYVGAFPNFNFSEGAFIFLVPLTLWAAARPRWRVFLPVAFVSSWMAWSLIVVWLRHLPIDWYAAWAAFLGLGLATGLIVMGWLVALRWALPRALNLEWPLRILVLAGLSGGWVLLEWTRSWLLTGFPWLPLSAAFWENPLMLSLLPWTGSYGLSFVLVFFNLGLAAKVRQLWPKVRRQPAEAGERPKRRRGLCPEFYAALLLLVLGPFVGLLALGQDTPRGETLRVAFIQPNIPAELKWDPQMVQQAWASVRNKTRESMAAAPELILWPETATPYPIQHYAQNAMQQRVEELVADLEVPVMTGNLGRPSEDVLYNGVFVVTPEEGVLPDYQAKRKLVPFGEYAPLKGILPLDKVVPIPLDTTPGETAVLLEAAGVKFGALVCYEDIFPQLARELVLEGAQMLYVATNNGWYGEEAGAYQHAASSVLRAAELRRSVLRCGNNGWSGWIDETGRVRYVFLPDEGETIYAGGWSVVSVSRPASGPGELTLYARWGDWFVLLSAGLCLAGFWTVRLQRAQSGS